MWRSRWTGDRYFPIFHRHTVNTNNPFVASFGGSGVVDAEHLFSVGRVGNAVMSCSRNGSPLVGIFLQYRVIGPFRVGTQRRIGRSVPNGVILTAEVIG